MHIKKTDKVGWVCKMLPAGVVERHYGIAANNWSSNDSQETTRDERVVLARLAPAPARHQHCRVQVELLRRSRTFISRPCAPNIASRTLFIRFHVLVVV